MMLPTIDAFRNPPKRRGSKGLGASVSIENFYVDHLESCCKLNELDHLHTVLKYFPDLFDTGMANQFKEEGILDVLAIMIDDDIIYGLRSDIIRIIELLAYDDKYVANEIANSIAIMNFLDDYCVDDEYPQALRDNTKKLFDYLDTLVVTYDHFPTTSTCKTCKHTGYVRFSICDDCRCGGCGGEKYYCGGC